MRPHTAKSTARIPTPGRPQGLLSRHIHKMEAPLYALTHRADGVTLIPLDGTPGTHAHVLTSDWRRLTASHAKDPDSPQLTRTRWMLEGGEVRALSLRDRACRDDYSYSVAALILGASDGDAIHLEDPLALLPEMMRLERKTTY